MIIQSLEFSQHFTRLVIQFYITPARQPIKNWHICNYLQQRAPFSSCLVYFKKTNVGFLHFLGGPNGTFRTFHQKSSSLKPRKSTKPPGIASPPPPIALQPGKNKVIGDPTVH
jgi:hypothetical protein